MKRAIVLYNIDHDAVPAGAGLDATSVESSAAAIARALASGGASVESIGVHGRDVFSVLERVRGLAPDLVFNLCESMAGDPRNEPTFVGLLDLYEIPYTGSDLLGLATCLYKHRAKDVLRGAGVSTPAYMYLDGPAALDDARIDALDYPWFVKLAHEDASIGITEANRVESPAALRARVSELFRDYRQAVLAERYIEGREINATLVGNGADLRVLPLHEIDFGAMPADRPRIVSYAAKWDEAHVDYAGTKPVPVQGASAAFVARVEAVARGAWHALGLRDYGRVDLRVDVDGQPWVIDVNPNPDLSPDAGAVRAAAAAGWDYDAFILRLAALALARYS